MAIVLLLVQLLASHAEIGTVSHDYVVATIGRWIPNGLVLAHEEDGDA